MKRGLIRWDRDELPESTFESRLERVSRALAERELPALVVYSDVWRSNQARFLTNFMPYWNRSLAVIPRGGRSVLLCGLSPRVYPWIRSVTVFDEIRPAAKLAKALIELCSERDWKKLGALELAQFPHEIYGPLERQIDLVDIPADDVIAADRAELAMRRRTAQLARRVLDAELPGAANGSDYQFAGRLERALRLAGAEDLVLLISTGDSAPRPACGRILGSEYSVSLAVEYCGHWVRITRAQCSESARELLRSKLESGFDQGLSGPYPWEIDFPSSCFARQVETAIDGRRFFYGDTFQITDAGAELL